MEPDQIDMMNEHELRDELRKLIARPSSCTVNSLVGRVVEIGDLPALDGNPGMVIECTREQLMAHGRNLAFENVNVQLAFTANAEVTGR